MAVLMPNMQITAQVRSHQWARDARGVPMPTAADTITTRGPFPASMLEQADQSWKCRLDPRFHPLRQGDSLTDGARTWTITSDPNYSRHPINPATDSITCTAVLDVPEVP